MNLETEVKIKLLVTFIQQFVTQSKFSLIFAKTLFPHKTVYFSNNSYDALKNADDSEFQISKLNN